MNEAILQALQDVEGSMGARLVAMNREIRGARAPPTRKERVPAIIQEGRLGAYYDILQLLAQTPREETIEAFQSIIRKDQDWLRADELGIAHVIGLRFRATYNQWQEHVMSGFVQPYSSSTALLAVVLGAADATRVAFDLPLTPYTVEAKPA